MPSTGEHDTSGRNLWPRSDVTVRIDIDPEQLATPPGSPLTCGYEMNLAFCELKRPSLRAVQRTLREEEELSQRISECVADGGDFDEVFSEAEFGVSSGGRARLDVCVAGAVLALNAAGFPTFYSCNGHQHGYPDIALGGARAAARTD
jgi:hypothetical protein